MRIGFYTDDGGRIDESEGTSLRDRTAAEREAICALCDLESLLAFRSMSSLNASVLTDHE